MASPARQPVKTRRWTFFAPLACGLVLSLLASLWVPWERVHPSDASLREAIGSAPFWSHRFDGIVGAQIDWVSYITNLAIIWLLCCAGAFMLRDRNSSF